MEPTASGGARVGSGTSSLQGSKILLCVTGSIAAYKAAYLARAMAQLGADVRVVMTPSAERFIGAQTFAAVTGNPVMTELFGKTADVPHVELARGTQLAVVAPATANSLAKLAYGFADDLFSATLLTVSCPILIAPAMHTEMWEHPATIQNVATLASRGVRFIGPEEGPLSSGDTGAGRMAEPDDIVTAAARVLETAHDLDGQRVLVTAGGTQEPIDPVRFISNRSSGLMGISIAKEALARGAKVTLVTGPTQVAIPGGADVVRVKTTREMRDAVVGAAPDMDVIIKAAAVADFTPTKSAPRKLKKAQGPPEVTLVAAPDILAELGRSPELRKPGSILIGFAAETEDDPARLAELALEKRASKGADVIVANDVQSSDSGFDVPTNRAVIAAPDGVTEVGLVTKEALAEALIDKVVSLLRHRA
ncbi:MAG: bifunctional phosphopantothenoylcysteine decarboxylase/phosphopantothenate--cysteine ligase CoaBC [Actinomycetota bacterium]|nr:bifunctional phosphopantothenoylcysteine decarboxylase/phosphopantothenate--cysteine ligase CoaBC [Actinomycetota bacterium]